MQFTQCYLIFSDFLRRLTE